MFDETESEAAYAQTLEQHRQRHLADRPSPAHRAELVAKLCRSASDDAAACAAASAHAVSGQSPSPADAPPKSAKLGWRLGLAFAAVACGAAALSTVISGRVRQSPETATASPSKELAPRSLDQCIVGTGAAGKLSDFEDASLDIATLDGRFGQWSSMNRSPTGEQSAKLTVAPSPEATAGNRWALFASGPPTVDWGAMVRVTLANHSCYDASAYRGIRFRARGQGPIFLALQTQDSVPRFLGGRCTEKCWFTSGRMLVLEPHFQTFELRFDELHDPSGAAAVGKDLLFVDFNVQASEQPYALWIDDVELMTD